MSKIMNKRVCMYICLLGLLSIPIAGCGVKPSKLETPGGKDTVFPRTYPDTATDPE